MSWTRPSPEQHRARREAERAATMNALMVPSRTLHTAVVGGAVSGVKVEKENASQSAAYMAAVRALGYCMRCGCTLRKGEGQFCHADQGKGIGIKTDVRRGWLGCPACHYFVGTSGSMPKAERRAEEDRLAMKTRALVFKAGTWPAELPLWKG